MAHSTAHRAARSHARPSFFASLRDALGLWRQRRHLAQLDPHLRRDLGLTDDDIRAESTRPIWDVPDSWRY